MQIKKKLTIERVDSTESIIRNTEKRYKYMKRTKKVEVKMTQEQVTNEIGIKI